MDYTDYIIAKAVALIVIVAAVNFFYALFTGRTIEQVRSDRAAARQDGNPEEN